MVEGGGVGYAGVAGDDNATDTEPRHTVHVGGWLSGTASQMKPLSDEFNELSVRAKKTEDVNEAAVAKDQEWLQARLDTLKSAIGDQVGERMVAVRVDVETKWDELRGLAGQPLRGCAGQG